MDEEADQGSDREADVIDDAATRKGGYGERSLPEEADGRMAGAARDHAETVESPSPPAGSEPTPGEQGA